MTAPPATRTPALRYVVITPVRNEARYLHHTISSMVRQTVPPVQWTLVDDGSTDQTPQIIAAAARQHDWIVPIQRVDRGFRKSGGGVVEAFDDGFTATRASDWEFVVKLDGDVTFADDYFEKCFVQFAANPRLGIGGGTVLVEAGGQWRVDSPGDPPFHVRGATKIYRRACWEQIAPLMRAPGWDTIDEVRANMHGWRTLTFADLPLRQQRQTGASDGDWRNWYKNGLANYITGYHPLFMIAKCLKRVVQKSPTEGAALFAGFCGGYFNRSPRVADTEVVRYLRRQQLRRLMLRRSIYAVGAADGATQASS